MDILVSMIIPAYQQEKRIGRCIESILASSYRNYEVIVVNDGSADRTEEIVQQLIEKTKEEAGPVIELINISHGGPARARNVGLKHAKGEFIGFLDADDMLHPQMLERLAANLLKGNDLAACGLQICDKNGKPARWQYPLKGQHLQCPDAALELVMWEQILMSVCPVLFRREKILDGQGGLLVAFPEELVDFEDFVFICRYLSRCDGFMEVLPFYGAFYCKHEGTLTSQTRTVQELCQAMQWILLVGEQAGGGKLTAHRLQYAFRFMAFWYEEASRRKKADFSPGCESWEICMGEMGRFADMFMDSPKTAGYQKAAMWIVRKAPEFGRLLAKTIGRVILPR